MPLRRRAVTSAVKPDSASTRRHAVFSLSGVDYAIEADHVRHFATVPGNHGDEVLWLGTSYPLRDLRALFRLPPAPAGRQFVLIVESDGATAGLLVDAVVGLTVVDDAVVMPLPSIFRGMEREWFRGVARLGDRIVVLVRVAGILRSRPSVVAWDAGRDQSPCRRVSG